MSTQIITNPSTEQQIADEQADLDYCEQRIAKWEARHAEAVPGSSESINIEKRLARLDEERAETKIALRALRQLRRHERQQQIGGAERVTETTPTNTPVVYRTHGGELRTGRFTGGIATNGVGASGFTADELGVGQNATRFEVSLDSRVGSTVWVEELFIRES